MTWSKLLFAHWSVPADALQALLPPGLEIETFEGQAYFALVPFAMSGVRFRGCPPIPGTHSFLEMNMRTYVRHPASGLSGVWFISLDSNSPLSNAVARARFHLRYLDARMAMSISTDSIRYESVRLGATAPYRPCPRRIGPVAVVDSEYNPGALLAGPDPLLEFFTNRFRLFSYSRTGRLFAAEIDHDPWPLQSATATFASLDITSGLGFELSGSPYLLYSEELAVRGWMPYAL